MTEYRVLIVTANNRTIQLGVITASPSATVAEFIGELHRGFYIPLGLPEEMVNVVYSRKDHLFIVKDLLHRETVCYLHQVA